MIQLLVFAFIAAAADQQFSLPQGPGPDGSKLITLYQCEGEEVRLNCPRGTINIVRANFGRYSIAVCNKQGNTNWTTDCASSTTTTSIKRMCEKQESCVVSVRPETLGDACPLIPKYLEVHYFCKLEAASSSPRQSPQFPDPELTDLWNQNSQKVNLESVLRAVKDREVPAEDLESSDLPLVSATMPHQTTLVPAAGDFNEPTLSSEWPIREEMYDSPGLDNSSDDTTSRTPPTPGGREGEAGLNYTVQLREEEDDPARRDGDAPVSSMFVLEVITYAVASVCGIILIFLVLKFRRSGRLQCSCLRSKGETTAAYSGSSPGSCLNSTPSEVQLSTPPEVQYSPPMEVQYSTPPEVQYSTPPEVQYSTPPEVQYSTPPEVQYSTPPEVQHCSPPEVQFSTPLLKGQYKARLATDSVPPRLHTMGTINPILELESNSQVSQNRSCHSPFPHGSELDLSRQQVACDQSDPVSRVLHEPFPPHRQSLSPGQDREAGGQDVECTHSKHFSHPPFLPEAWRNCQNYQQDVHPFHLFQGPKQDSHQTHVFQGPKQDMHQSHLFQGPKPDIHQSHLFQGPKPDIHQSHLFHGLKQDSHQPHLFQGPKQDIHQSHLFQGPKPDIHQSHLFQGPKQDIQKSFQQ